MVDACVNGSVDRDEVMRFWNTLSVKTSRIIVKPWKESPSVFKVFNFRKPFRRRSAARTE